MRLRSSHLAAATALLVALGCSGLFGYGDELGETPVQSGSPFTLAAQVSDVEGAEHKLWLEYEVEHSKPFRITGNVKLVHKGAANDVWTIDLTEGDGPVKGEPRVSLNRRSGQVNGKGTHSETIRIAKLPDLRPGQWVKVRGRLDADSGTRIVSARLVLTD